MKLLSVNVSLPKEVPYNGKTITTGIFKEPVDGRVRMSMLNIEGDGQADRKVHGGRDHGGVCLSGRALPILGE